MRYRLVHHTEYRYVQPVALCHNETHLRPWAVAHQRCLPHALVIDPEPDLVSEREDFFGNPTASFSMQRGHSHLWSRPRAEVEVGSPKRPGQVPDVTWEEAAELLRQDLDPERVEARQFILDSPLCEAAADIIRSVAELSARIHRDFAYVPGFTSVTTPLSVAGAQPERPLPPPRGPPNHRSARPTNSTGCKAVLNVLSFHSLTS
ncbi:MAG: hypothetical protein M3461_13870 [Pseudomonadota bacterium]|nr:hypothetical protein [Pseudomonadota bacterium]